MAFNSPLPTYLVFNYSSLQGVHKMLLPTKRWAMPGSGVFPFGQFQDNDGSPAGTGAGEVGSMVGVFADLVRSFLWQASSINSWELWQVPNPTTWLSGADRNQLPDVVANAAFTGKVGLETNAGVFAKAVQMTHTFRTAGRGILRVQIMDATTPTFERNFLGNTEYQNRTTALATYMTGEECFLLGRNGGRPTSYLQTSITLNEKLRRAYGMT